MFNIEQAIKKVFVKGTDNMWADKLKDVFLNSLSFGLFRKGHSMERYCNALEGNNGRQ